jgi:hypothetical protein
VSDRKALVVTKDLFFRAKLTAALEQSGFSVSLCGSAPVAVIELGTPNASARIERLVADGTQVVAFGSHLNTDGLKAARAAGAMAVPNSEIERVIREELAQLP